MTTLLTPTFVFFLLGLASLVLGIVGLKSNRD